MFGLVVLAAALLYFALMFAAMRWAWQQGRMNDGSRGKAAVYTSIAFLVVYLPVFWDHIPTVFLHRHLCAKDGGFTAFVDAKKWNEENFDAVAIVNQLTLDERMSSGPSTRSPDGFLRSAGFGGLLRNDLKTGQFEYRGLIVRRIESRIADARTGEILAKAVDYSYESPRILGVKNLVESCVAKPPSRIGQSYKPVQPFDFLVSFNTDLMGANR